MGQSNRKPTIINNYYIQNSDKQCDVMEATLVYEHVKEEQPVQLSDPGLSGEELFEIGYAFDRNEDYPMAIKYYQMAIDRGNAWAMNNMGLYCENITKDYPTAIKYYQMAIDNGIVKAMNNMGVYYHIIKKDYPTAIKYYQMAIDKGNANAMNNMKKLKKMLK